MRLLRKTKAKSAGGQSGTFDSAAVLAEYPQFRFDALRKEFWFMLAATTARATKSSSCTG